MPTPSSAEVLDLVIVGAGPAGLHAAHLAARSGIHFAVFDDHARVGDPWRERYRSLRLFTPRRWSALPGTPLDVGFFEYPTGAQLADYLERYAKEGKLPVRLSTRVTRMTRQTDGQFLLEVSDGSATGGQVLARRVIVASGASSAPIIPPLATLVDTRIRQLHSLDYRGAEDLAPGPVLVVGAGNSGADIALEAVAAGHPTVIAGRVPGEVPGRIDTPIGNLIMSIFIRRLRRTTLDTERGRRFRDEHIGHGVNLVRHHMADLEKAGIRHIGRIHHVVGGLPATEEGEGIDASTVVWCTGARPRHDWVDIPAAFGPTGLPAHERGMATAVPGLAFMGLPFQHSIASPTLMGMGPDARYVIEHVLASCAGERVARRSGRRLRRSPTRGAAQSAT